MHKGGDHKAHGFHNHEALNHLHFAANTLGLKRG
jgi:hypothetical protein